MKKDKEKTIVIFRKFKSDGAIIAFFPAIEEYSGTVMSYMHLGQHGAANYNGLLQDTKLATKKEYLPLFRELESIGYNLEVRSKKI